MCTVEEIQSAIESLSHKEYMKLISWIHERDWKKWDKQLEDDVASGKLDFLVKEAMEEKRNGKLKEL